MDEQTTGRPRPANYEQLYRQLHAYPVGAIGCLKLLERSNPEAPSYLLTATDMIVSFAKGHISYEEYREKLDAWWEQNNEAWPEHDLSRLFRLICLTN
jgi:hypothetical protein